jgi:endonuclease YncB( thermonuclease family)
MLRSLAAVTTLVLLGCSPASIGGLPARVVSISDGDTISVQQGSKRLTIRLACIDAPGMAQPPYGSKARDYLRLPVGRPVMLKVQTTDRYGRTVAEMFSDININLALVEDGQAFAYRKYLGQCDAKE